MVTNLTNLTSGVNFYDMVKYSNDVTTGTIGLGLMLTTFIILLSMFFQREGNLEKALLASSFLCFLFSIALVSIGLVNPSFIIIFASMTVITSFWVYFATR